MNNQGSDSIEILSIQELSICNDHKLPSINPPGAGYIIKSVNANESTWVPDSGGGGGSSLQQAYDLGNEISLVQSKPLTIRSNLIDILTPYYINCENQALDVLFRVDPNLTQAANLFAAKFTIETYYQNGYFVVKNWLQEQMLYAYEKYINMKKASIGSISIDTNSALEVHSTTVAAAAEISNLICKSNYSLATGIRNGLKLHNTQYGATVATGNIDLYGINSLLEKTATTNATNIIGYYNEILTGGATSITNVYGNKMLLATGGTITNRFGINIGYGVTNTLTNHYGIYLDTPTGVLTNSYGLYIKPHISASINNYSIYQEGNTSRSKFEGIINYRGVDFPTNIPSVGQAIVYQGSNASAWATVSGGSSTLQSAYDAGNTILVSGGNPVTITDYAGNSNPAFKTVNGYGEPTLIVQADETYIKALETPLLNVINNSVNTMANFVSSSAASILNVTDTRIEAPTLYSSNRVVIGDDVAGSDSLHIEKNVAGPLVATIQNPNSIGTSRLSFLNGTATSNLSLYGTAVATSGHQNASGLSILNNGHSINLVSSAASGIIRFYTGSASNERFQITSTGNIIQYSGYYSTKFVANSTIAIGDVVKASSAVAGRVSVMLSTDNINTPIIGVAVSAATTAGDVYIATTGSNFTVRLDNTSVLGDVVVRSDTTNGRVKSAAVDGTSGQFAVLLQAGVAGDLVNACFRK